MGSVRFVILLVCPLLGATPCAAQGWQIATGIAADLLKPKLTIRNQSGASRHVALDERFDRLTLVMEDDTVRVWDLRAGVQLALIEGPRGRVSVAAPAFGGRRVVFGDRRGGVYVADLADGSRPALVGSHGAEVTALAVSPDGETLVSADAEGRAIAWKLPTGEQRWVAEGHDGAVHTTAISDDGSRVATGGEDRSVRVWAADSGRMAASTTDAAGAVREIRFLEGGRSLVSATSNGVFETIEIATGARTRRVEAPRRGSTRIAISPRGDRGVVGYEDGRMRVYDLATAEQRHELIDEEGAVGVLAFLAQGRRLLSTGEDGVARIWDPATGESLARMISTSNGWSVVGRHGRFDGSEGGIDDVGWEAGEEDLPLDRFSERYFEPGLLASHLKEDGEFVVPDPVSIRDGIALPPLVLIASVEPAEDGRLVVAVTAEDRGGGIDSVRLYHNGKLVAPASLLEQRDVREGDQHIRGAGFVVDRAPGPNSFKATATGRNGIDGESQRLTRVFEGPAPESTLHVAAVGVNRYREPALALDFSVPDAQAISSRLTGEGTGPFASVRDHRLLDEQATKNRILELFRSFGETRPADVVVVYLSGHGVVVGEEWYFLPYEATYVSDPTRMAVQGLSASEIQEALVTAKAQRVLLMIDSCYSGAGVMSFEKLQHFQRRFLRSLSRIAGVTVLAATRSDQQASERLELGHGVFTYVVLEGLAGGADTRPRDGRITAHELVAHSVRELPSLFTRYFPYRAPQEPMAFALGADFLLHDRSIETAWAAQRGW